MEKRMFGINRNVRVLSIRAHLMALAVCAIVPVLVLAAILAYVVIRAEQDALAEASIAKVRATMRAIDTAVLGHISALQMLAASSVADTRDLHRLQVNAPRILKSQRWWENIIV